MHFDHERIITMKHPTDEQWAGYVYDELPAEEMESLRAHLDVCETCRASVEQTRLTMQRLDSWELNEEENAPTPPVSVRLASFRWAAVAAIFLGLGILIGRAGTVNQEDLDALRAELSSPVPTTESDVGLNRLRGEWNSLALRLKQQQEELRGLRRDLETVALSANTEFARTKRDFMKLVALKAGHPSITTKP